MSLSSVVLIPHSRRWIQKISNPSVYCFPLTLFDFGKVVSSRRLHHCTSRREISADQIFGVYKLIPSLGRKFHKPEGGELLGMGVVGLSLLRLLVVLLGFSRLFSTYAVPSTRTEFLTHGLRVHRVPVISANSHVTRPSAEEKIARSGEYVGERKRIDLELNDYPGSGANNRHTPKPQFGRGCIDC